jgi:hypothetical protein
MAFSIHLNPDHVHVETSCGNHLDCKDDLSHWNERGPVLHGLKRLGLPEGHPHHVEHDCDTGQTGYTRLTAPEIAARAATAAADGELQANLEASRQADLELVKSLAAESPKMAALLRHLRIGDVT